MGKKIRIAIPVKELGFFNQIPDGTYEMTVGNIFSAGSTTKPATGEPRIREQDEVVLTCPDLGFDAYARVGELVPQHNDGTWKVFKSLGKEVKGVIKGGEFLDSFKIKKLAGKAVKV